jgi:hypothetical protein
VGTVSTNSPIDELKQNVIPALTGGSEIPWNEEFDAITSLRRILIYHPEVVTSKIIESLVPGMEKAIRNSRSVLAKNSIYCAEDLFLKCSAELNISQKSTDVLAFALLDACASNSPKQLKAAALNALNQAVQTGPLPKLAPALATRASHKNPDVSEQAMVFAEKALKALERGSITTFARNMDVSRMIPALMFGLSGKTAPTKKAARDCCVILSSSLSFLEWENQVNQIMGLTPLQVSPHTARCPVRPRNPRLAPRSPKQMTPFQPLNAGDVSCRKTGSVNAVA